MGAAVKISDVMTIRPLVVGERDGHDEVAWLMDAARVHHLPLVYDRKLVGLWVATDEGPLVLLSPDAVYETTPDADALTAISTLLSGREAIVVWQDEAEQPVGVLTRTDAIRLLRMAIDHDSGRRRTRPVVVRLVGPAGVGKSTLIVRTLERLRHVSAIVVQANPGHRGAPCAPAVGATRVIDAPEVHWAKGFGDVLPGLADAQLVLVEDRDGPPALGFGFGEDLQVVVVSPLCLADITPETLENAGAVVITNCDRAAAAFDPEQAVRGLRADHPELPVFAVSAAPGEAGLREWTDWLEGRVLARGHR